MQFESDERSDFLHVHPNQASRLNDLLEDQPTRKMRRKADNLPSSVDLICGLRPVVWFLCVVSAFIEFT